jgi:transcriptional regulator with XRE-family HTH domain
MDHVFDRDKLRVLLRNKGYTVSDFAKMVGVSPSAISSYLSGRNNPSFVHARKIADLLLVDVGEMMTGYHPPLATAGEPTQTKQDTAPAESETLRQGPIDVKTKKEEVLISAMQTATELLRVAIDILKDSFNVQKG